MHQSFESWGDDFRFSDDLRELEESLRMLERDLTPSQTSPQPTKTPSNQAPEADEAACWEYLADAIVARLCDKAERLTPFVQPEPALPLSRHELLQDSQVLAQQVQSLLAENHQLREELKAREAELSAYWHAVGPLYIKR